MSGKKQKQMTYEHKNHQVILIRLINDKINFIGNNSLMLPTHYKHLVQSFIRAEINLIQKIN